MDTVGPITTSGGNCLILTIVDLYTRYGAAIPLRRQTTANIVTNIMKYWFNVHGMPRVIISDNGSGFKAKTMQEVYNVLKVKVHFTSPYHPQSNGACERLNGTLINMLVSYTNQDNQNQWVNFVQQIVFAYNTSIHSSTGYTPYFLIHGREAIIGDEAILSSITPVPSKPDYVRHMLRDLQYAHQHIADRVKFDASVREKINDELKSLAVFRSGDQVYVYAPPKSGKGDSKKLMSRFHGPFTVLRALGRVTYLVENNSTHRKSTAHVTLIKKVIPRPDHLVPSGSTAVVLAPVVEPDEDVGVSSHTRRKKQRRALERKEDIEALGVDPEHKYNGPVVTTEVTEEELPDSEEDYLPPDAEMELEEGEVPPSFQPRP